MYVGCGTSLPIVNKSRSAEVCHYCILTHKCNLQTDSINSLLMWTLPLSRFPQCCSYLSLLPCYLLTVSVPHSESWGLYGSFKHNDSGSRRLWLVWDWTRLCCWAQRGLAYSDDLTYWPHSARSRMQAALCLLHEVILVSFCSFCVLETEVLHRCRVKAVQVSYSFLFSHWNTNSA